jgi:hypothetical protein
MIEFSAAKYLAGTVAIPATFPDLAKLKRVDTNLEIIDHRPNWSLTRIVPLADVVLVYVPEELDPDLIRRTWKLPAGWYLPGDFTDNSLGIAYVRENAIVLMQAEFGMNAAESAEYCPTHSLRACNPCCEGRAMH